MIGAIRSKKCSSIVGSSPSAGVSCATTDRPGRPSRAAVSRHDLANGQLRCAGSESTSKAIQPPSALRVGVVDWRRTRAPGSWRTVPRCSSGSSSIQQQKRMPTKPMTGRQTGKNHDRDIARARNARGNSAARYRKVASLSRSLLEAAPTLNPCSRAQMTQMTQMRARAPEARIPLTSRRSGLCHLRHLRMSGLCVICRARHFCGPPVWGPVRAEQAPPIVLTALTCDLFACTLDRISDATYQMETRWRRSPAAQPGASSGNAMLLSTSRSVPIDIRRRRVNPRVTKTS